MAGIFLFDGSLTTTSLRGTKQSPNYAGQGARICRGTSSLKIMVLECPK